MIETVTVERRRCDICGGDAYKWTQCLSCGKDLCPTSTETNPHSVRYAHAVGFSGGGDGYYCIPCDIRLSEDRSDPLHQAYVAIRDYRDEQQRLYETRKQQGDELDQAVRYLRSKRGLQ